MVTNTKNNREMFLMALGMAGMPVDRLTDRSAVLFCDNETSEDDPATFIRFTWDPTLDYIINIETGKLEDYHD